MKANPIRRGHVDEVVALAIAGLSTSDKAWYAVCPTCGKWIMHRYSYPHYGRTTRKNTKDALYRHVQKQHKPGLVGR